MPVHTVCTSDVKACAISRRHTVQYETAIWIDQIEWPVYFRCNQFLYKHCWLSIDTKSNHCLIHCAFQPPQLTVLPLKWTELMKPISILLFCNIYNKHIRLVSKAFGQREGGEIEIKLTHWKVYLLENPIIIRIYTHAYAIFGPAVSPDFVRSGEPKPKAIYRQAKNSALKWGQENLCAAGFFLICLILHIKKWSKKNPAINESCYFLCSLFVFATELKLKFQWKKARGEPTYTQKTIVGIYLKMFGMWWSTMSKHNNGTASNNRTIEWCGNI